MEFFFQLIFELLLQLFFEGALDLAIGRTAGDRPLLRFLMFLFIGAAVGGLSVWVLPNHIIAIRALRYASAVSAPVVIGLVMTKIGSFRRTKGSEPYSLEHFFSAWVFAFMFGAIRVLFAK